VRRNAHAIEVHALISLTRGSVLPVHIGPVQTAALVVVRWFYGHLLPLSNGTQIALSTARIHGTGLEFKHNKAGVSLDDSPDAETSGS
jgi:hypothetical protein